MTLQTSGQISLLDLKAEFSDTNPVNLGDYYRGGALNTSSSTNVSSNGAISIGMFYGLSAINYFNLNQTITTDTNRYDLHTQLTNAGWNGSDLVYVTITINTGIVIYSDDTSPSSPALSIPYTIPSGSVINIINNGYIIGMGGAAGNKSSFGGRPGGTALSTKIPVTITNNGTIGGGGGGGSVVISSTFIYGGGGGRTGRVNSAGGTSTSGQNGQPGTFTSAGEGSGNIAAGGTNAGGNWGEAGKTGSSNGGAGGKAVAGNSHITWISTGTIMGTITAF